MTINKADIKEFLKVVDDATEETAKYYLEMCGGNSKEAINLYYELHTQGGNENETSNTHQISQQRNQNINEPNNNTNYNNNNTNNNNNNNNTNNNSLMNSNEVENFVRAPDKHFNQALIHDMDEENFLYYTNRDNKKNTFVDIIGEDTFGKMFAPPQNIICKLNFEEARKKAKRENKYILVHIQNSEFDSMRLNRDIWKDDTIQQIISDSFIFWLRHETDKEAIIFMHAYKVNKLPHICALCKRTGKQLKTWNLKQFEDIICAQSQLYEFVENAERKYNKEETYNTIRNETKVETSSTLNFNSDYNTDQKKKGNIDNTLNRITNNTTSSLIQKTKHLIDSDDKTKNKDSVNYRAEKLHKTENKKNNLNLKKEINKEINTTTSTISSISDNNNNNNNNNTIIDSTKTKGNGMQNKKIEDSPTENNNKLYNNINNELSELHKLRLERMKKK